MSRILLFLLVFLAAGLAISYAIQLNSRSGEPEEVIAILEKAIEKAGEKGVYKCCIEPACDMCYLGHWKFEKGTCYCDDAIKEGRDEDVCPQCIKGLENGECSSAAEEESCDVEINA